MSKIGKQPIILPDKVQITLNKNKVVVEGPKGRLEHNLPSQIGVRIEENKVFVEPKTVSDKTKALHGTLRSLISNMVKGVSEGWSKQLELVGSGYRAEISGNNKLVINVGFSHPIEVEAPDGILFKLEKNIITVEGIDKEKVGQVAAEIRSFRPPEPYKGKGIKYVDEIIRRKAGKAAKTQA